MKLAIIGTAGRNSDARLITEAHWRMMCVIGQTVAATLGARHLVSGGSAWADHIAVQLYLDGHVNHLTLHLPCDFIHSPEEILASGPRFDPLNAAGCRLNELHGRFHDVADCSPLMGIARAIAKGAEVHVNPGGFLPRNIDVAKSASSVLAFTFGPIGSEGGTAHCWRQFHLQVREMFEHAHKHYQESPCGCSCNIPDPVQVYHFDLTCRKLTRHTYEDHVTAAQRAAWEAEIEANAARRIARCSPPQRTSEDERRRLL